MIIIIIVISIIVKKSGYCLVSMACMHVFVSPMYVALQGFESCSRIRVRSGTLVWGWVRGVLTRPDHCREVRCFPRIISLLNINFMYEIWFTQCIYSLTGWRTYCCQGPGTEASFLIIYHLGGIFKFSDHYSKSRFRGLCWTVNTVINPNEKECDFFLYLFLNWKDIVKLFIFCELHLCE